MSFWFLKQSKIEFHIWYEKVFNDQEIKYICDVSEKDLFPASIFKGGENVSYDDKRSTSVKFIDVEDPKNDWLYRKVTDLVLSTNNNYFDFEIDKIESLQFAVYKEGDYFNDHIDLLLGRPYQLTRKLSFVVFLSDPSEYDGGELILKLGIDKTIPNQKGNVVFFPSFLLHEVTPVTRGIRKTLVGWVNGPSFK